MDGRAASAHSVKNDPKRSSAGSKPRSAASSCGIVCYRMGGSTEGSAAPQLDSEQFRSDPMICPPLCGRFSGR